jgi:hypothetical protein
MSKESVEALIKRAAQENSADQAMKFAQAALNAANAMCSLLSALETESRMVKK